MEEAKSAVNEINSDCTDFSCGREIEANHGGHRVSLRNSRFLRTKALRNDEPLPISGDFCLLCTDEDARASMIVFI